jgi:diaminopimelate decarboxylase
LNAQRVYERPGIVRHQMGLMNKFGRQPSLRPLTHIDGVAIADLVAEHGSPLFVISQRSLVRRYRELHDAFARRWPKVRVAWSYKTNYLEAVCRTFHAQGAWAEVVSPFEWDKAVASGVSPDRIHWNGPFKPEDALERAIAGGTLIHIDNFDEIVRIERVAARLDRRPRVALRINVAVDGVAPWSRFGVNLESGQAAEAAMRIVSGGKMDFVGLHCHIGTFIADPAPYGQAAGKLARFANELRKAHGVVLEFLDVGGGFASPNTLKGQYHGGEQTSPSFARYADAICDALTALDLPASELPTLVLETGRALVDEAATLVATVHATKRLPEGQRGLVLDAGVNLLFTSFWYNHDVVPAQEFRGMLEPTVLYGPLCMNIDVLRDAVSLPPLSPGDRLCFRNVGAYNMTQWMQFIALRPAVVMIGEGGRVGVVRRAENVSDFKTCAAGPAWAR